MRLDALGRCVGLAWWCGLALSNIDAAHALRVGDSLDVQVMSDRADASKIENFPGVTLCLDGTVPVKHPVQLLFPNGFKSGWLDRDVEFVLEAHEGVLQKVEPKPRLDEQTVQNADFNVQIRWAKCTFDTDETLPLQLLFAFGSIASVVLFVGILLDSRMKRHDKYF